MYLSTLYFVFMGFWVLNSILLFCLLCAKIVSEQIIAVAFATGLGLGLGTLLLSTI